MPLAASRARAAFAALALATCCADQGPDLGPGPGVVLVGAGDIADCQSDGDEATAALLDTIPGTVFTLGDNAYPNGSHEDYANCYQPSWGRHKVRTRPAAGNHEYHMDGASPYFEYFGAAAGEPGQGYYSYDLGEWHMVVLNTHINVNYGSPQERWLDADLATNRVRCTLVYMHHPRYSSDLSYVHKWLTPIWSTMHRFRVDVVLAAHDHAYERFEPLTPYGAWAPGGIRQFVVGTGGASPNFAPRGRRDYHSETRLEGVYGVLKLTLLPRGYTWHFISTAGGAVADSGRAICY